MLGVPPAQDRLAGWKAHTAGVYTPRSGQRNSMSRPNGMADDSVADDILIDRIRLILARRQGYAERRMFGTVCFMIRGNMCAGTWKGSLIVRLDRKNHDATLAEPHAGPARMNGRTMRGWALVEPAGIKTDVQLAAWLDRAARFAASLPAKPHASAPRTGGTPGDVRA